MASYTSEQLATIVQYATDKGCNSYPCITCRLIATVLCQRFSCHSSHTGNSCRTFIKDHPELFTAELITEILL